MDGIEYVVMPQIMDGGKAELIGGFYRRDLTCVRLGNWTELYEIKSRKD